VKRLPRQIKWHLNQLVGQAYENELSRELERCAAFAEANVGEEDVEDD
jgi:hypothetical protein